LQTDGLHSSGRSSGTGRRGPRAQG
jgi:hypothetical protein